jgi:hypothetical protein
MNIRLALLLLGTSVLGLTCDTGEEPIPAYIHIPAIGLSTSSGQGSASRNINYAWVYANGQFLGGYPLPITFPVLEVGPTDIIIEAGIKANGIGFTPDVYPFYARMNFNLDLQPQRIDTLRPVTTYRSNAEFAINENFDASTHLLTHDLDTDPGTSIQITSDGAFEGSSGYIELTKDHSIIVAGTSADRVKLDKLPQNGTPVWLELDYKNDIPITIGVNGINSSGTVTSFPDYGINPRENWNKIYLDITQIVRDRTYSSFQVFVSAILPSDRPSARIYLDNLKLVHLEQ